MLYHLNKFTDDRFKDLFHVIVIPNLLYTAKSQNDSISGFRSIAYTNSAQTDGHTYSIKHGQAITLITSYDQFLSRTSYKKW